MADDEEEKQSMLDKKSGASGDEVSSDMGAYDDNCCYVCKTGTGVAIMNVIAILIVVFLIAVTIVLMGDEYIDLWCIIINSLLILGLGVTALVFIVMYMCGKDSKAKR